MTTNAYPETNVQVIEKALYCLKHGETESVENWLDLLRERLTENSRADALTEAVARTIETIKRQLDLIAERAPGDFLDKRPVVQSIGAHVRRLEKALAAPPVEQPAAAPIENAELASMTRMFHAACHDLGLINEALGLDPEDGGAAPILDAIAELKRERDQWVDANYATAATAPSPADERVAFEAWARGKGGYTEKELEVFNGQYVDEHANTALDSWLAARAASASQSADERAAFLTWWCADIPEHLRAMWKESDDACLREGTANERMTGAWEGWQARAASASETGAEVARIADDMRAEQTYLGSCREACDNSGRIRWDRLQRVIDFFESRSAAMAAEQVAIPAGYALVPIDPVVEMQIPSYLPDVDWPTRQRIYRDMIAARPRAPQPAQADAREEAYVAKRMAETLATVYATIVGDDQVDENDGLNAIQRCERAAQVLRLEVELYRGQADARVGLTDEQKASITWAIRAAESRGYVSDAEVLRALLQGANHAE